MPSLRKLSFRFLKTIVGIFLLLLLLLFLVVMSGLHGKDIETFLATFIIFIIFIGIAFLVLVVYLIVGLSFAARAKDQLKNIRCFDEDRFEREVKRAPKMKNLLLCSDAICFCGNGNIVRVIPIEDIVWVYQAEDQNGAYLKIYLRDKTEFKVPVIIKKKIGTRDMACRYILRLIARKSSGVLIGYEEEYETIAKRDFNQLLLRMQAKEIVDSRVLEQEYIANNYYVRDFQ